MLRILVIEDTPANMALATDILESAGHATLQAAHARQGIEMARSERPDVVLMDMQLPGMDGLEATRVLKDDARTRDIPVVAFTARAMKGDDERMRQAGCAEVVSKPIRWRDLLAAVDAAVATPR
jgi:two-component system, cell cycle response regulator DivK